MFLKHQLQRPSVLRSFKCAFESTTKVSTGAIASNLISWYPGHIAKAERELADYLKKTDVVIELRDARIPIATTHPSVPGWVGNKPLIVVMTRLDQICANAVKDWKEYYSKNPAYLERPDAKIFFIDGKSGTGVAALKKHALTAGASLNEKRARKGIQPRAVRAAVIGFPNVGKSALINKLLGKKLARSRNVAGVTRQLMWVKLGGDARSGAMESTIELLDSPGIIPARQFDQQVALKLAICNDIGEASYDTISVAAAMCELLSSLHRERAGYVDMALISKRYQLPAFADMTGMEVIQQVARQHQGNLANAAIALLTDFRKGLFGLSSLESPEDARRHSTEVSVQRASAPKATGAVRPKESSSAKVATERKARAEVEEPAGEREGDEEDEIEEQDEEEQQENRGIGIAHTRLTGAQEVREKKRREKQRRSDEFRIAEQRGVGLS